MDESTLRFSRSHLERLESETFVEQVVFHEQLASTSDLAAELCLTQQLATPLLVLANQQTAGRGRGSNRWWAGEGALTFSVVLDSARLGVPPTALSQLSLVVALAARDALASLAPTADVYLKWPNDLLAAVPGATPRKLAGILLECPPGPVARVVMGMGINVNNSHSTAPADVRERALSLRDLSGNQHPLVDVLRAVLHEFAELLPLWSAGTMDLPTLWKPHCLLHGRSIVARSGDSTREGVCQGIDDEGALLLDHDGRRERLFSATIERF